MINIALLGHGIVGSGVVEVLRNNSALIAKKAGAQINLKYILDIREIQDEELAKLHTTNFDEIINDGSVKVVVEVMGGLEPAYSFVKSALLHGKHVVTSNKEVVEMHGAELLKIAKDNNVNFLFEASSGGCVPIIRNLKETLISDKITEVKGILNGSTNYILTKMTYKNQDFDSALKEAQEKGYAEKNPVEDVEGFDTARKIAIIFSLITEKKIAYKDIKVEGIKAVTPDDIEFAKMVNGAIKLVADGKIFDNKIAIEVSPTVFTEKNQFYYINNVNNCVSVKGKFTGELCFSGEGAGQLSTATAVITDMIDAIKHIDSNIGYYWEKSDIKITSFEDVEKNYFNVVKLTDVNKDDAIESIKNIFKDYEIKIVESPNYNDKIAFIIKKIMRNKLNFIINNAKLNGIKIESTFIFEK